MLGKVVWKFMARPLHAMYELRYAERAFVWAGGVSDGRL